MDNNFIIFLTSYLPIVLLCVRIVLSVLCVILLIKLIKAVDKYNKK